MVVRAAGVVTVWHRLTLRRPILRPTAHGPGPPAAPGTIRQPHSGKGAPARRYRLNVKPSPKTRDLDRAFAHHVEIVGGFNIRRGIEIRAAYSKRSAM